MNIKKVLALVAVVSACSAFADYKRAATNEWFNANVPQLTDSEFEQNPPWQHPSSGDAELGNAAISVDTDFDDPLVYAPTNGASETFATIVVNVKTVIGNSLPDISILEGKRAALTAVSDETNGTTNWYGLVNGDNGAEWRAFDECIPEAGAEYTVTIDFDTINGVNMVCYSIDGVALGDGWYEDASSEASSGVSSVAFAGQGVVSSFLGNNIFDATITASTPMNESGYDYRDGSIGVSVSVASIISQSGATATLTLKDKDGTTIKYSNTVGLNDGENALNWDIENLTQGGAYTYEVVIRDGDEVVDIRRGEFTAATWGADGSWFKADATSGTSVVSGGEWDFTPTIANNAYKVSDSTFEVSSTLGQNKLTSVDTAVNYPILIENEPDEIEEGAISGFVATKQGWKVLIGDATPTWQVLTGVATPETNVNYVIRSEFDFASATKAVRYFVKTGDGDFVPLTLNGSQWITLTTEKDTLSSVEFYGTADVATVNASVANDSVAAVDGEEYRTFAEALAEAKNTNKQITLLTNVRFTPTAIGSYHINKGAFDLKIIEVPGFNAIYDEQTHVLTVTQSGGEVKRIRVIIH